MWTLTYVSIPVVGALIGWGTNVLAIRMLFRPRSPRGVGWLRFQGVIPRRKAALACSVAEIFERELLSNEELIERFQSVPLESRLEPLLDNKIESFLSRWIERMPMVKMFFSDGLRNTISVQLRQELMEVLPQVKQEMGRALGQHVNLRTLIEDKVRGFSERRLEEIILSVAKRELKAIEWLGGLLGLAIGLIQLALMSLMI